MGITVDGVAARQVRRQLHAGGARSTLWFHDLEDHYEGVHKRKVLAAIPPGAWAAPPLTFSLPAGAGYAGITEGALTGYSGMALEADGSGAFHARLGHAVPASYPFRLRYKDEVTRLTRPASISGPIATPWRVVLIGADSRLHAEGKGASRKAVPWPVRRLEGGPVPAREEPPREHY